MESYKQTQAAHSYRTMGVDATSSGGRIQPRVYGVERRGKESAQWPALHAGLCGAVPHAIQPAGFTYTSTHRLFSRPSLLLAVRPEGTAS